MENENPFDSAEGAPKRRELLRRARELQLAFRRAPVGGRWVALKRLAYRLTASAFDRQAKAVEALLGVVEEIAVEIDGLAGAPEPPFSGLAPVREVNEEGTPRSVSKILEVDAAMSMPERILLYSLVFGLKPRRCLEIGTFRGGSAAVICAAMDDNGFGRLACVDPEPRIPPEIRERIAARATVVQGSSPEVLERAREAAGGRFDFALIDGDHSVEGVLRDISGVLPEMTDGAYLLFHDCHFIDVAEAIDEALRRHPQRLVDCGVLSVHRNPMAGETYRGWPVVWGGMRLLKYRVPGRRFPDAHS